MSIVFLLLLVGAAVCFTIAALGPAVTTRVNLLALGLLLWVLVPLLQRVQHLS